MKFAPPFLRRRQRGAVLVASLMFAGMTATMVGAGLWVSSTHYDKAYAEARSESALLLAEGGINDELAHLAEGVGNPDPTEPVAAPGETAVYPGENHAVYGRKGSIDASDETYWVCTSANEWANSGATPQPWDGVQELFWVTASANVKGSWRRTEVQVSKQSLFGPYAVYTNGGDDDCTTSGLSLDLSADVVVNGTSGTNGKVTCATGAKLSVGSCVNANKNRCSSPQYTSAYVRAGASLCARNTPYAYPTCTTVLKKSCGLTSYSDSGAWSYLRTNNDNYAGIYTYRSGATSASINTGTCVRAGYTGTTCRNFSYYTSYSSGAWDYCRSKPGTSGYVKTLILEPGDYYFSSLQLAYDAGTELVIDPQAFASGGTPGQVRIWINDTSWFPMDDEISIPIKMTTATGTTEADPSLFRIFYSKDGNCLRLNRPANCRDYRGYSLIGDFEISGGIYAVTRSANSQGCTTTIGAQVKLTGSAGTGNGKCSFTGSLMCDRAAFSGPCKVEASVKCSHKKDPPCGARVCGGYRACR